MTQFFTLKAEMNLTLYFLHCEIEMPKHLEVSYIVRATFFVVLFWFFYLIFQKGMKSFYS
jgi:hypothetical protein